MRINEWLQNLEFDIAIKDPSSVAMISYGLAGTSKTKGETVAEWEAETGR